MAEDPPPDPRVQLILNTLAARWARLGLANLANLDRRRDVDAECGYPDRPLAEEYQALYDRSAVAARVVEVMPKECWAVQPELVEIEDGERGTPFERAWDDLGRAIAAVPGIPAREPKKGRSPAPRGQKGSPAWAYLLRADVLSGIGQYGAVLLGLDDGADLAEPVRPKRGRRLLYLRVFGQVHAPVAEWDLSPASPRYGMPAAYNLQFANPADQEGGGAGGAYATLRAHWTRVVHVADLHHTASPSEWAAVPRMRPVLNHLLDLRKIHGASAEGYWQSCFAGLSFETAPSLGAEVQVDQEKMRQMVEAYVNGLQRYLALENMTAKTLAPSVVDPSPHVNAHVEAVCVKLQIPVRIFKGSERGELASGQDDSTWNDRVRERQHGYLTPSLVRPFADRLVWAGVLPEPGNDYEVRWPDLAAQSEERRAQVALVKTQALSTYVSSGAEALVTPFDYLTRVMDFEDRVAGEIVAKAEEAAEEAEAKAADREPAATPPPGGGAGDPGPQEAEDENVPTGNAFCPTGKGGGVDPTCSPKAAAPPDSPLSSWVATRASPDTYKAEAARDAARAEHAAAEAALSKSYSEVNLKNLGHANEKLAKAEEAAGAEGRKDLQGMMWDGGKNRITTVEAVGTRWTDAERKNRDDAQFFVESVLSKEHGELPRVIYARPDRSERAHHRQQLDWSDPANPRPGEYVVAVNRRNDAGDYVHELGHHVEKNVPGALDKAKAFLEKRVGAEPPTRLAERFPGSGYESHEYGRADDFGKLFRDSPSHGMYAGKVYGSSIKEAYATEVVSMGLELMFRDPRHFARTDPEYFDLMVSILQPSRGSGAGQPSGGKKA